MGSVGVRVVSLASGSSGNALLIDAGQTRLLIDVGLSALRIERELAALGVSAASLTAVLVSHEHIDHVAGLSVLGRRHRLPLVLTAGTAEAVPGIAQLDQQRIGPLQTLAIGTAQVTAIPVRHDAAEPCGFQICLPGATIVVLTDLGYPDRHLDPLVAAADLIVVEANHDLDRLWSGPYTWPLKQRVASETGHLCNDDCGLLLARAINDERRRTVWLAHLSAENNDPTTARTTVAERIGDRPLTLAVLPRRSRGPIWQR